MSESEYLYTLEDILNFGVKKEDRTGTGTISKFGLQLRFNLQHGFPLLTTKKVYFKGVVHELLWFLKGETNIKYLVDNNVHIWDDWADKNGNLGPVYGSQWRSWITDEGFGDHGSIDQIGQVIEQIKTNPFSRRHIVTAWNPAEVDDMALPPCHLMFQFNVRPDENGNPKFLDCQLYQRSADFFLGVPFNIASYALLTHMVAQVTGLIPGDFVHTFGDAHIYLNHVEQVKEQLSRKAYIPPTLVLDSDILNIDDFKYENVHLVHYHSHPAIKAEVSV